MAWRTTRRFSTNAPLPRSLHASRRAAEPRASDGRRDARSGARRADGRAAPRARSHRRRRSEGHHGGGEEEPLLRLFSVAARRRVGDDCAARRRGGKPDARRFAVPAGVRARADAGARGRPAGAVSRARDEPRPHTPAGRRVVVDLRAWRGAARAHRQAPPAGVVRGALRAGGAGRITGAWVWTYLGAPPRLRPRLLRSCGSATHQSGTCLRRNRRRAGSTRRPRFACKTWAPSRARPPRSGRRAGRR